MSNDHHHHSENMRRVVIALILTGSFMIVEVIGGVISGSLALLADAGHMLTDTMALALAAKDAQLMRFRGELDSLLDALRAAVADKARAQAAVSEKLAADHLEFANEAFDVGAAE